MGDIACGGGGGDTGTASCFFFAAKNCISACLPVALLRSPMARSASALATSIRLFCDSSAICAARASGGRRCFCCSVLGGGWWSDFAGEIAIGVVVEDGGVPGMTSRVGGSGRPEDSRAAAAAAAAATRACAITAACDRAAMLLGDAR